MTKVSGPPRGCQFLLWLLAGILAVILVALVVLAWQANPEHSDPSYGDVSREREMASFVVDASDPVGLYWNNDTNAAVFSYVTGCSSAEAFYDRVESRLVNTAWFDAEERDGVRFFERYPPDCLLVQGQLRIVRSSRDQIRIAYAPAPGRTIVARLYFYGEGYESWKCVRRPLEAFDRARGRRTSPPVPPPAAGIPLAPDSWEWSVPAPDGRPEAELPDLRAAVVGIEVFTRPGVRLDLHCTDRNGRTTLRSFEVVGSRTCRLPDRWRVTRAVFRLPPGAAAASGTIRTLSP